MFIKHEQDVMLGKLGCVDQACHTLTLKMKRSKVKLSDLRDENGKNNNKRMPSIEVIDLSHYSVKLNSIAYHLMLRPLRLLPLATDF